MIQIKTCHDFCGTGFDRGFNGGMGILARHLAVLCLTLMLAACGRSDTTEVGLRRFEARGIVRGVAPDHTTIEVEHETIPGFMPSMTMPFTAHRSSEIAGFQMGDAISFQVEVTDKDVWISNLKKIAPEGVSLPKPTPSTRPVGPNSPRLRDGDAMPVFDLRNENGERINLDTFHNRSWIVTFIFTRCPMPNFCPRISRNFQQLQNAIQADRGALAKVHLLSITLDPGFDTSEILKSYGQNEGADPRIWSFATGDPAEIDALTRSFSVFVQAEGGTISHGLATALVGPDGNIVKIWRGNAWTPPEVIQEIRR